MVKAREGRKDGEALPMGVGYFTALFSPLGRYAVFFFFEGGRAY